MSLSTYVSACREQLLELKESLSGIDIELLHNDCCRLGRRGWMAWCYEHETEITKYVEGTPTARGKQKKWQEDVLRRRLTFAAIQHVYRAKYLLEGIDMAGLYPGGSYRSMSAAAGHVYSSIFYDRGTPEWPLEGSNPFDE